MKVGKSKRPKDNPKGISDQRLNKINFRAYPCTKAIGECKKIWSPFSSSLKQQTQTEGGQSHQGLCFCIADYAFLRSINMGTRHRYATNTGLLLRSDTILKAINTKPCLRGNPSIGKKTTILNQSRVAVVVDFKDQAGEQQTMQQNLQNISLKTGAPMESHAATILTPFAFSKLQEQLVLAAHYASFQMDDGFLVRHHTKADGGRKVYWVPREGIISCSCHQFEFSGILCRHALRVLSTGNCFQIPDSYLPIRWRRISMPSAKLLPSTTNDHAERIQLLQSMVTNLVTESAKSRERLDIATEQVSLLLSRVREHPTSLPGNRVKGTFFLHGARPISIANLVQRENQQAPHPSLLGLNACFREYGKLKRKSKRLGEVHYKKEGIRRCSSESTESLNASVEAMSMSARTS
uniref:Protein FAR1-RELATED SEQUENCE n=1 Tax=Cucumis melo TaxID=3656 RepID=A0A9I9EGL8_CUCME